ncbi:LPXTG cell wall anchor domain-containing protein [Actinosynnema sp. NPDC020468]|uniref:LPXTG cell wall anchor domain-containing protein n=1 Tax=Actinosynnema sp. NPDC020468 TaxID=3154488 RepID=UPI00340ACF85
MYRPPAVGGTTLGVGGVLAFTGSELAWYLALGVACLVAGLFLVRATRRRVRSGQD